MVSASVARSTPGWSCVADGTDLAAAKLERVLTNDPGMGVIRHADAGYERAREVAAERGVRIPMTTIMVERQILGDYWRDGAVCVRNAFDAGFVDLARQAIEANLADARRRVLPVLWEARR